MPTYNIPLTPEEEARSAEVDRCIEEQLAAGVEAPGFPRRENGARVVVS